MSRHPLLRGGLYAITDGPRPDLLRAAAAALAGGAALLQYRDKTGDGPRRLEEVRALVALGRQAGVPVIVNDDVALARAAGAAGVHLGREDEDVAAAREALGADAIIGVSCYNGMDRAHALAGAADYLGFGAFHLSVTKPHAPRAEPALLRQAAALGRPLVAIGGITPDNGGTLVAAGADYLAAVSGVFAQDDIAAAARRYAALFEPERNLPAS